MEKIYIFEKLTNTLVSKKYSIHLNYNTKVQVPKHHVLFAINLETNEKQRMYEGNQSIKSIVKKLGFFELFKKVQKIPFEFIMINTERTFENLWGGRFLFEDKTTYVEVFVGVNGKVEYSLTDYEYLYDLMEKDNLEKVDLVKMEAIYDKYKKIINNAIINYLTNWSNQFHSIKDLNNKKQEAVESIIKALNDKHIQSVFTISNLVISEYISQEAEQNRIIKNDTHTKAFIEKHEKVEDKVEVPLNQEETKEIGE
jgi:hypothetical protein